MERGPERSSQRFAGQRGYQDDDGTGMRWLGSRYYLPALGRFLTPDPIGQEGGLNLYGYCGDSPLGRIDPAGTIPWSLLWTQHTATLLKPIHVGVGYPNGDNASPPDVKLVTDTLMEIYHTPRGREIVDNARRRQDFAGINVILDRNFNNGTGDLGGDLPEIRWNPSLSFYVDTNIGPFLASPRRILAHELGHALTGLKDYPNSVGDPGPNVRLNEHPIAASWGEPLRVKY